ncbi:MAG: helix-turn-helix transcriptional regulator [Bacilli bacterium]|nr:helix-turn-helix transcriptional regulator [Bacilli bacterium]
MTLKEFRLKKEKTQQEMADLVGITQSMYEKLEYNERKPSVETIQKFKTVFKDFESEIFLEQNPT